LDDWIRAKRIPGSIHFERLKHALSQGGGHRRPPFSEPKHYEHYAFSQRPQSPNVRHNASGCARSLEPLPTLYLASEANVISLVEV
jgi:hypothetical protein